MKINVNRLFSISMVTVSMLLASFTVSGQEMESKEVDMRPVKDMFSSIWLIDNQTVVVPYAGTFEFDIQHRFGTVKNGYEDLFGLYAPANIRLGFSYVIFENCMLGMGITKSNLTWDFNGKYAFMQQSRQGGHPLSISYYLNVAFDTRDKDLFVNPYTIAFSDRVSFFHQLMIARKFSDKLSVQVSPSLTHFNTVDARENAQNEVVDQWKNDHVAVSVLARYGITPGLNVIVNYDQPLTQHPVIDPEPNIAFGLEVKTSAHQFQIFLGNYYNILPQRNNVFNTNKIGDGEFLIGFNITRLWNF